MELNWLICTAILCVIIVPSNILVVKVWNMRKSKTPIPLLLSTIAISNSLFIVLDLTHRVFTYTDFANGKCLGNHILGPFVIAAHAVSMLTTTFIAVQRCAVCVFPFKGPKLFGYRTSAIFIGVISVLVIFQQAVWNVFITDINTILIPDGNRTMTMCAVDLSIPKEIYETISEIGRASQIFINHIATFIIVIICMTVCAYTLQFKRLPSSQRSTTTTTLMVVLVMLLFTIGQLPGAIGLFMMFFLDPTWYIREDRVYIGSVINKVCFALHIVVYLAISRQFRIDFLSIFCVRKTDEDESSSKKTETFKVNN